MTHQAQRPTLLDRADLVAVRVAKLRRARVIEMSDYENFFHEPDVEKILTDVRYSWRFGVMRQALDKAMPTGEVDVVDVGCGLGASRWFLPERCRYTGIDVSRTSLAIAHRVNREGDLRHGALPNLPLASSSQDFAVCLEVLEHIEDDRAALIELRRILRPGAHLLVSVPRTFYWPAYRELIGHHRHYSGPTLRALLDSTGYHVVKSYRQHTAFWHWYHYFYGGLRTMEVALRRVGLRRDPFMASRSFRRLAARLLKTLLRDAPDDARSTFLLARRSEEAE